MNFSASSQLGCWLCGWCRWLQGDPPVPPAIILCVYVKTQPRVSRVNRPLCVLGWIGHGFRSYLRYQILILKRPCELFSWYLKLLCFHLCSDCFSWHFNKKRILFNLILQRQNSSFGKFFLKPDVTLMPCLIISYNSSLPAKSPFHFSTVFFFLPPPLSFFQYVTLPCRAALLPSQRVGNACVTLTL